MAAKILLQVTGESVSARAAIGQQLLANRKDGNHLILLRPKGTSPILGRVEIGGADFVGYIYLFIYNSIYSIIRNYLKGW